MNGIEIIVVSWLAVLTFIVALFIYVIMKGIDSIHERFDEQLSEFNFLFAQNSRNTNSESFEVAGLTHPASGPGRLGPNKELPLDIGALKRMNDDERQRIADLEKKLIEEGNNG